MRVLVRLVLLPFLPALAGCASLYFPPPPQAPLLTQKGEFSGGLHTNFSSNTALQGAYALGDHVGVLGSASFLHSNKKQSFFGKKTNREFVDHDFGELGMGYFTRLKDQRVIEFYGGYGLGHTKRTESSENVTTQTLEGNLEKYFFQVNYSKKESKTLHLFGRDFPMSYGAAMRASYVQLYNFTLNGQPHAPESNIFFEPITFTRIQALGPIQLQFISGSNFGLRHRKYLKAANSVFQFGIVVNLGGQEGRR
ncbi:hypothetical protein SAMN02745146_2415 [Hymenobacter daecheongensis DSM 21074]|uniref:Outer membrane protein beta-barrel domain-containing protein n=1 Tax=Hymenobacter daecheongensis DSM 21074 TaxID=1121955 RepID=A0A1M6GVV6_9BACT|nr:hypothetical protein [Hymenobacter daecheongensis]SHJ14083.1 hypothetical protein SAMN02745146_2415 [Hymenobacter daecheongensis DSM 21074]